ncbi:hypothetical protein [Streptomyces sp. NPDC048172]|uniref:SCO2584 family spore wall biosynthesis protein n=1 Tax=Streptomyces sp. NPDC048172 TaxID=3365505 RepID=UPI003715B7F4
MPDDVGGQPFQDGEEPDSRDHGAADDEFASVVLDEDFVRAAEVHEPTATERILAAAQSHAESELPRIWEEGYGYGRGDEFDREADPDDPDDAYGDEGRFDRSDYTADFPEYDTGRDGRFTPPPSAPGGYDPAYGPGTPGYPPELDPAYEHGSDYGYGHGTYGAYGRSRGGRFGGPYGTHGGALRPYRGHGTWQRPIAWVLAVVMGIGMVALAFTAVYRGAASQRQDPSPPPATTGVEPSGAPGASVPDALPSVSADTGAPTASAEPPPG